MVKDEANTAEPEESLEQTLSRVKQVYRLFNISNQPEKGEDIGEILSYLYLNRKFKVEELAIIYQLRDKIRLRISS
ncbi:hypothetical protein MK805_15180 [Shimazuella sp. AN120528]|uniref:hypothetical protein n=1 Tax=Shimazuella soli TaxID=1892854 RepID=UPI001F0CE8EB|nr:hypothetical protein [Shimazuella soli]MCH5586284.1 hypothetical protein [Shimazuella soli]